MPLLTTDQMSNGASSCSDMNAPTKVIFTAGMLSIVGSSVILTMVAAKVIENSPVVMPVGLAMFRIRVVLIIVVGCRELCTQRRSCFKCADDHRLKKPEYAPEGHHHRKCQCFSSA